MFMISVQSIQAHNDRLIMLELFGLSKTFPSRQHSY